PSPPTPSASRGEGEDTVLTVMLTIAPSGARRVYETRVLLRFAVRVDQQQIAAFERDCRLCAEHHITDAACGAEIQRFAVQRVGEVFSAHAVCRAANRQQRDRIACSAVNHM